MNDSPKKPNFFKLAVIFIALAVAALLIIFVVMSSIGDDVPTELPAATQTSPGN